MDAKNIFEFGFVKDNNNLIKEVFRNNAKFKEVHIDVYPHNPMQSSIPFVLLLRTIEENVTIYNDGRRLILKMNDRFGTYIMNVLFSDITECFYSIADECYDFILNVQNIYYKLTVLN